MLDNKEPEWFLVNSLYWYNKEDKYCIAFSQIDEYGQISFLDYKTKQPIQNKKMIKFCNYKYAEHDKLGIYIFPTIEATRGSLKTYVRPRGFYKEQQDHVLKIPIPYKESIDGYKMTPIGYNIIDYKQITLKKRSYNAQPYLATSFPPHWVGCPIDKEHICRLNNEDMGDCIRANYFEDKDNKHNKLEIGIEIIDTPEPSLCFDDTAISNTIKYTNKDIQQGLYKNQKEIRKNKKAETRKAKEEASSYVSIKSTPNDVSVLGESVNYEETLERK